MLLFLHLPKSGGTTVTQLLSNYLSSYDSSLHRLLYGTEVSYADLSYLYSTHFNLIAGHLNPHHLKIVDEIYENKVVLKTLREPFSRFKSTLLHAWKLRRFPGVQEYPQVSSRLHLIDDIIKAGNDKIALQKSMESYYLRDVSNISDQNNISLAWRAFSFDYSKVLYKYNADFILPTPDIDKFVEMLQEREMGCSAKKKAIRANVSPKGLIPDHINNSSLNTLRTIHFELYSVEYKLFQINLERTPNIISNDNIDKMLKVFLLP